MKKINEPKWIEIYEKKLSDFNLSKEQIIGIYGTGNGAEVVYEILDKWGFAGNIKSIIENDEKADSKFFFHGIVVEKLSTACDKVDVIIVSSMDYHEIVSERVKKYLYENKYNRISIINLFGHNTDIEKNEFVNYLENNYLSRDEEIYKEHQKNCLLRRTDDTKVIAWYLPQYHRIDVNDKFYGRGFTEWTNTTRTLPMFVGHYQPHIPYDLGYYSLNDSEVFPRQIELAKHYGIYGFSFYYYWFSGKRIMEKPLNYFLEHKELDFKYCLTWANENWSTLWDGGNKELIYKQELKKEDDYKFIDDALPYFLDERYITINGKKLLIIYRINIWEKERVIQLLGNMRSRARERGIGELYIMLCNARGFDEEATEWGGDAIVEFPPHGIAQSIPGIRIDGYLNPKFMGYIRPINLFIKNKKYLSEHKSKKFFRGVMTSWDNTARKAYTGAEIYTGLTPKTFEQWLFDIISESKKIHSREEDFVFVNAWNEWAEGTHLEPDMKYGYANLVAVKNAIEKSRVINENES